MSSANRFSSIPYALRTALDYRNVKAAIDLAVSVVLLVATCPVVLVAALLVRLTSAGPAFYSQVRVGRNGRHFTLYKLRTMYHDCERVSGPQWSLPDDPRVTPLGRWLRRTHVDELPQLWNVARGEMSLIGPRPERPCFVSRLEPLIPRYADRLLVRPGISGLAQVLLPPDEDFEGVRVKVAHDRLYVKTMSPWLDFKILGATALKLVGVPYDVIRQAAKLPRVRPDFTPRVGTFPSFEGVSA